jgi:hypothetical protein
MDACSDHADELRATAMICAGEKDSATQAAGFSDNELAASVCAAS